MKLSGRTVVRVSLVLGLVACGSDDDAGTCEQEGGEACFELPTAAMVAWKEGVSSAPNLACEKPAAVTSTQAVTISGTVKQYTSSTPIAGVTMEAHTSLAFSSAIATATTATDGTFSATFPSGTPSVLHLKVSGAAILPALALYQRFDVTMPTITMLDYRGPTEALLDTIETLTKVDQLPGKSAVAAVVTDCDGKAIEHAIATVSSTSKSATHVAGVNVFYGVAGELPLPVIRSERGDSNNNGAIALLNVPAGGTVLVQAWGFVDAAAVAKGTAGLKLLAEWEAATVADGAVALPLRASASP